MSTDETESERSSSAGSCVGGDGGSGPGSGVTVTETASTSNRQDMYDTFKTWALQNYGDSGKTKTVTRRKYDRIVNILTGEEPPTSENSKFRFWVKAKGFCLSPIPTDGDEEARGRGSDDGGDGQMLYVPTKMTGSPCARDEDKGYKRVAVVEDFFDIIYDVHVEMDGRGGKHAGQKRTYRAIAETYAFLPREAVTRFLMSCSDCQKRMHLSMETNNNNNHSNNGATGSSTSPSNASSATDPPIIDFSVPITTTYLNHMRGKGKVDSNFILHRDKEDSMSSADSDLSREGSPSPAAEEALSPRPPDIKQEVTSMSNSRSSTPTISRSRPIDGADVDQPVNLIDRNGNTDHKVYNLSNKDGDSAPVEVSRGHPERKRRASDEVSVDSSTRASESGLGEEMLGVKDEEGDDDEDDEEKLPAPGMDPERLKAFNMFVRLFVDENLDRMVPISKQPKDKIQAILEACDRQFPEFHERSRKRIRTYLKSCRRMRRSKEANGWEPLRPTPPHLTSAAAESILAQACENESNNAKRMRMGLEPLANSYSNPPSSTNSQSHSKPPTPQPPAHSHTSSHPVPSQTPTQPPAPVQLDRQAPVADYTRHPTPHAFRPPHEIPSPFFANSNGMFRPGFPTSYQHPAHQHPPTVIQHTPINNQITNGPTDLSMKKSGGSSKNQLNPSEVATIKQLIAGYRESAAFLYRSADELEQLLLQQN